MAEGIWPGGEAGGAKKVRLVVMLILGVCVCSLCWLVPEFGEVVDLIQRFLPQVAVGSFFLGALASRRRFVISFALLRFHSTHRRDASDPRWILPWIQYRPVP